MIERFEKFITPKTPKNDDKYPAVRHLSLYESAISIMENGFILSRNEMKKNLNSIDINVIKNKAMNSKDRWWDERKALENKKFGTEDIIYCTPDWFNDSGYETGHGAVMFYFKPSIFEDFKVTLTITDSLMESNLKIYNNKEIQKIYSNIIKENYNKEYEKEAKKILENLNNKNEGRMFNTSKGLMFIEGNRFYNKYSEIQLHINKIPIKYIQEIRLTDNFLDVKDLDDKNKEKLIRLSTQKNIKIYDI